MTKKTRVEVLFRPGYVHVGKDLKVFVCHSARLPDMISDLLLTFRGQISELRFSDVLEEA